MARNSAWKREAALLTSNVCSVRVLGTSRSFPLPCSRDRGSPLPGAFEPVRNAVEALERVVRDLEPGCLDGAAAEALQTARALEELPATADAFRTGALSDVQAREITAA